MRDLAAAEMDDAVNRAAIEDVRRLLENGVPVDIRDVSLDTPLMNAAWVGSADIVELLIAWGADVHAVGGDGRNALQRLLGSDGYWYEGHDRCVELLRAHGVQE